MHPGQCACLVHMQDEHCAMGTEFCILIAYRIRMDGVAQMCRPMWAGTAFL
ncbi:hypothetical protein ACP70R_021867 [Stipagrostis hirtigluma subsp. patula]